MSELWQLSASDTAARVKSRTISARDVLASTFKRIDEVNPKLNAIVDSKRDESLKRADEIDAAIARGEDPGTMAGVPITIKVNADQVGFATTNGLKLQRDLIAATNNPVVDNLLKAGAVIVGRTNTPAFSYRWFTTNLVHGDTKNPHDDKVTPGGSSGGAAASVASGMGAVAHGTDIGGSIRYPAYACGVHGLRPGLGRVPAYNPSLPERGIGAQLMAASGPLARSIEDVKLAFKAMSLPDRRDPWHVAVPFEGPDVALRAAVCLRPDGLATCKEVVDALEMSARILRASGWVVDEVDNTPPLAEASQLQLKLWLCDGFDRSMEAAELEGDPGALTVLRRYADLARSVPSNFMSDALTRRATLIREWQAFFARYAICLLPVSAELAFEDGLDQQGDQAFDRVWNAQMTQTGLPFLGLPGLTVTTGMVGSRPVGIQITSDRFREDLCLLAGQAIETESISIIPVDPAF